MGVEAGAAHAEEADAERGSEGRELHRARRAEQAARDRAQPLVEPPARRARAPARDHARRRRARAGHASTLAWPGRSPLASAAASSSRTAGASAARDGHGASASMSTAQRKTPATPSATTRTLDSHAVQPTPPTASSSVCSLPVAAAARRVGGVSHGAAAPAAA